VAPSKRELRLYEEEDGTRPFDDWLISLRDAKARSIIRNRLPRLENGNFGSCKQVGGGVHELKIDFGPGYRVYFGNDSDEVVLLLGGGDKSTQAADIKIAMERWENYNA
jgi:putative addiction module killer protein